MDTASENDDDTMAALNFHRLIRRAQPSVPTPCRAWPKPMTCLRRACDALSKANASVLVKQ
jgi:hypothetical protein